MIYIDAVDVAENLLKFLLDKTKNMNYAVYQRGGENIKMEYTDTIESLGGEYGKYNDFYELIARGKSFAEIDSIMTTITRFEDPEFYGYIYLKSGGSGSKFVGGI